MKPFKSVFSLFAVSALTTFLAHAQATRTWISGVGDDANPCSRTAPCKTWAGAISKTAAGGEIDALDPGGFGALTITKSVTLDGGGGQVASVLVSGTNGIVVAAAATDVVILRNLRFQGIAKSGAGGLNGIQLNSAGALHVEHCYIMNFTEEGINLTGGASQVFIEDTVSEGNEGNGLNVKGTGAIIRVSVFNSHFVNNLNGVYAADDSLVTVSHSEASGNSKAGFTAGGVSSNAGMNLVDSTATNNLGDGVEAGGTGAQSVIRATNVALLSNGGGFVVLSKGKIDSFGNNSVDGVAIATTKFTYQ